MKKIFDTGHKYSAFFTFTLRHGLFVSLLLDITAVCKVHVRDASAQTAVRAATLREKMPIKLTISPSHSALTPGQPVLTPTL